MKCKLLRDLCALFCLLILFTSCRKAAFEEYYGRPDNLQPPIYQVLDARGNFKTLLTVIDRSAAATTSARPIT